MTRFQKPLALLLAALLLVAALPIAGLADSYRVETLKLNQWYILHDSSDMTIYRLKLTGETVVSFGWKGIKADDDCAIHIYRDKRCRDGIDDAYFSDTSSGSGGFVLYAGTYYILMYNWDENGRGKIRFSTKKATAINKANYCLSKAIHLKAGKKVEIAQTKTNNYTRCYKLKLARTQAITFNGFKGDDFNFTLYDSNLNRLSCSYRGNVYMTEGMQPKGTYYLEIGRDYLSELRQSGQYIAFSWK